MGAAMDHTRLSWEASEAAWWNTVAPATFPPSGALRFCPQSADVALLCWWSLPGLSWALPADRALWGPSPVLFPKQCSKDV